MDSALGLYLIGEGTEYANPHQDVRLGTEDLRPNVRKDRMLPQVLFFLVWQLQVGPQRPMVGDPDRAINPIGSRLQSSEPNPVKLNLDGQE